MIEKNQIFKIYGTDFKEMTKRLLEEAELASCIGDRRQQIGIKPNLLAPTPADYGATTHPEVVAGIIEYLQEHHFERILLAVGSWVGDKTPEAYEMCGFRDLCERYGVPFVDTKQDSFHTVNCAGMKISVCDVVRRIDFLINVPVVKGHCQTKVTCALKNMKGLIPDAEKSRFHRKGLHKPIAHLQTAIRQDFIVADHICGDLDFEEGGRPVVRNCVMAARDPVLVDSHVCHLLGYTPDDVPYVRMAENLGIGSADLSAAEILNLNTGRADTEAPFDGQLLDVSYAVDEVDSCSACYASLTAALYRLEEEGLLAQLDTRIGIGQGMRGRRGHLGVGRCTADFEISIPGCPPDEETIYKELKKYICRR